MFRGPQFGPRKKRYFEMPFCCAEKAFKLLAQKVTPNLRQKVMAKLKTPPELHPDSARTPPGLRQDSAKTPSDGPVRNRDFVDFEQFSIAYVFRKYSYLNVPLSFGAILTFWV